VVTDSLAIVSYKSSYSVSEGSAELRMLPNGKIEWKVINKASGQTFFPNNAILSKN
jgi:hypothetical protein